MHTSKSTKFSNNMRIVSAGSVRVTHAETPTMVNEQEEEDTRSFDEGFQAGVIRAQQEAEPMLIAQQAQIEELQEQVARLQHELPQAINEYLVHLETQAREEVTELAFTAAEVIVHREVERESPVRKVLTEALQRLSHLNEVKLMVSPSDYQLLSSEPGSVPAGIQIVQDAQLTPGEVFLESPQGFLDGKVPTRLDELRGQFTELLNQLEPADDQDA